jgi:hypothetical protein
VDPLPLTYRSAVFLLSLWKDQAMTHVFFSARQDMQALFYWYSSLMDAYRYGQDQKNFLLPLSESNQSYESIFQQQKNKALTIVVEQNIFL